MGVPSFSPKFLYHVSVSYTHLTDGTIYTVAELTSGGAIIALNPDGTEKWVYKTPGAIVNGGVVIGTDGTLYALSLIHI